MVEEPIEHDSYICNYLTGLGKAMEASATFDLILGLHGLVIGIEHIVSDDDSTICTHHHHIGTVKNDNLLLHISQPSFLCDPSHFIKVVVNDIFALVLQSQKATVKRTT